MSAKPQVIYIDACPLIDLGQAKSGVAVPVADTEKAKAAAERIKNSVWFCQQALRAARAKKLKILTSFLSIAECTSISDGTQSLTSPPDEIKRFYDMLLLSGRSGIELVPITQFIATRARDLRWISNINLKGADTIHVASAMQMKCAELWTRDGRIWSNREKLAQLGLNVVTPYETRYLPDEFRSQPLFPED